MRQSHTYKQQGKDRSGFTLLEVVLFVLIFYMIGASVVTYKQRQAVKETTHQIVDYPDGQGDLTNELISGVYLDRLSGDIDSHTPIVDQEARNRQEAEHLITEIDPTNINQISNVGNEGKPRDIIIYEPEHFLAMTGLPVEEQKKRTQPEILSPYEGVLNMVEEWEGDKGTLTHLGLPNSKGWRHGHAPMFGGEIAYWGEYRTDGTIKREGVVYARPTLYERDLNWSQVDIEGNENGNRYGAIDRWRMSIVSDTIELKADGRTPVSGAWSEKHELTIENVCSILPVHLDKKNMAVVSITEAEYANETDRLRLKLINLKNGQVVWSYGRYGSLDGVITTLQANGRDFISFNTDWDRRIFLDSNGVVLGEIVHNGSPVTFSPSKRNFVIWADKLKNENHPDNKSYEIKVDKNGNARIEEVEKKMFHIFTHRGKYDYYKEGSTQPYRWNQRRHGINTPVLFFDKERVMAGDKVVDMAQIHPLEQHFMFDQKNQQEMYLLYRLRPNNEGNPRWEVYYTPSYTFYKPSGIFVPSSTVGLVRTKNHIVYSWSATDSGYYGEFGSRAYIKVMKISTRP